MVATAENPTKPALSLGGVYYAPEAARYINAADCADKAHRVSSPKLRGWIRRGLASPDLAAVRGPKLTLTFQDLISMRAVAVLRSAGAGWTDIKKAASWLREVTGAKRPFASEYLWTGRERALADSAPRPASDDENGRTAFDALRRRIIPAHGLTFDENTGMADSWTPSKGVRIHPQIHSGAPCIEGRRIPTDIIYGMVNGGDPPEFVARSYRISMESLEAALDWESRLNLEARTDMSAESPPAAQPFTPTEIHDTLPPNPLHEGGERMTTMTAETPTAPKLSFVGIYGASEAARYINAADCAEKAYRVSSPGLIRWIGRGMQYPDRVRGAALTFEDLISMRVMAALRGAGAGWKAIKNSESMLRETIGAKRPFASERLWAGQGRAFADWSSSLIAADKNGQAALDALRRRLIPAHGLTFNEDTGMAWTWTPAKGVKLHPQIQFGAPCIPGTRIPTSAIYGMVNGGDPPGFVARSYDISMETLEAALDWEYRLNAA